MLHYPVQFSSFRLRIHESHELGVFYIEKLMNIIRSTME
jgi:hypothetical protein